MRSVLFVKCAPFADGRDECAFIDLRGCYPRAVFRQIMIGALAANRRLHASFERAMTSELRRVHTEEPRPGNATGGTLDEALAAMRVHEAGEPVDFAPEKIADYDAAFRQLISDGSDEDEEMDDGAGESALE